MKNNIKTYFGFALADGMFAGDVTIVRRALTVEEAKAMIGMGVIPCLNPSHQSTISAMKSRYGIEVPIPEVPPRVELGHGDSVIVMGVRGLPRLTDRHEYTDEEVAKATFSFAIYTAFRVEFVAFAASGIVHGGGGYESKPPTTDLAKAFGEVPKPAYGDSVAGVEINVRRK